MTPPTVVYNIYSLIHSGARRVLWRKTKLIFDMENMGIKTLLPTWIVVGLLNPITLCFSERHCSVSIIVILKITVYNNNTRFLTLKIEIIVYTTDRINSTSLYGRRFIQFLIYDLAYLFVHPFTPISFDSLKTILILKYTSFNNKTGNYLL